MIDGRRIHVSAVVATDPESVRRTSDGYRKKYKRSKGSLEGMLRRSVLPTTLRLEPV